ncbi:hypothetical protein KZ838_15125, partial [Pseudomonas aeruginosa]|nr:hypothetical protein [Pseudomonas aeruginosa]
YTRSVVGTVRWVDETVEALAGRRSRLDLGAPERWVGGVCLRAGTAHWALDEQDRPVWREDPRH